MLQHKIKRLKRTGDNFGYIRAAFNTYCSFSKPISLGMVPLLLKIGLSIDLTFTSGVKSILSRPEHSYKNILPIFSTFRSPFTSNSSNEMQYERNSFPIDATFDSGLKSRDVSPEQEERNECPTEVIFDSGERSIDDRPLHL